ncbi:MAG: ATP synthase F1 subunit gamma [Lentimicrobiaceae bacterium]|nr:ATP synthase F1 subunit gamma [Lentimicrobiaceae bacterium]
MSNLKEIRTRIASVESTQKMTSAMKLVSAAKLRRAQNAISNLKPYSNKLNALLENLSASLGTFGEIPLFAVRKPENVVVIAITSNRGLCGAFNANIIKEVQRITQEEFPEQVKKGTLKLICIGKKAVEQLRKNYSIRYANELLLDTPNFEEVDTIATDLICDFCNRKIDKIAIVYNHFVNVATQRLMYEPFLPIAKVEKTSKGKKTDYLFEPSQEVLLNELIPKILKLKLYKALLDSIAADHGARMTAMAKATDNATEILKELKLSYNNARQAAITNELNEIVGGAEALNN